MPNVIRLDFSTLTVKAEEAPKCSLFLSSSVGSPVRRLPREFTPTYFQTSSNPMWDMGAVNSVNTDHQGVSQEPFSGQCLRKLMLTDFAGNPLEWLEWVDIFHSTSWRSSQFNDEKMSPLKALLTGAVKRSVQCLDYSGSKFNAAWSALKRKFGQPHCIISAQLSRTKTYSTMK